MSPERAERLAEHLVNSTTGWTPESILELTNELEAWRDEECATEAIEYVRAYWNERSRPPLGWIIRAYNVELDAKRRDAALNAPSPVPEPHTPPAQGREIAFQAYRQSMGLPDDAPTRERFRTGGVGQWASFVEQPCPDEDVAIAVRAIGTGVKYVTFLRAFGGDHLRAGRALRALEKSGRVLHDNTGWIVQTLPIPAPPGTH